MRRITIILMAFFVLSSCKKNADVSKKEITIPETKAKAKVYPENVAAIFDAHGGLETWSSMENLTFGMQKGEDMEMTTTALKSRKSLIETSNHKLGFDGKQVWLQNKDTVSYKGKAKFYYNLMFYFYAMPFVLADDGITYKDVPALEVEGKKYPGIHISYDAGVGESPEDEYILYYDNETKTMAWLAYTVTFFSKEKASKYNLIKYSDWQDVGGLQLPATLQWHVYKDGIVGDIRNEVKFTEVVISDEMETSMFSKPENSIVVE